ncbi:MAG: SpoIIIAH-like family protein [Lachnospiraceae bacterium]|nr:SpoIIIAH-like family protein [Lachnospiraceae bacterium]
MKKIFRKNQVMISVLAIMIAVAAYLNFAGTQIGEQDFLAMNDTEDTMSYELTYETTDISAEDMLASNFTELGETENEEAAEVLDTISLPDESFEVPGEAVFTSATVSTSLDGAKLLKEQTRAKNKETLLEIINNENLTEAAKQEAVDSMVALTEISQMETDAEVLLEAKGYSSVVVSISDNTADVMVEAAQLTDSQTAQIIDIVQRKTEVAAENIIITLSNAK